MNSNKFTLVKKIFLQACELEGDDRKSYLDEACGADETVRQEVASLLGHHNHDTITEPPARISQVGSDGISVFSDEWVGRQLGKYSVSRVLDSGGMGIVVEAHDSAIDRHVAIKVLRAELAHDESTRQRFQAEARAAGRLNHPNVITIHDVAGEDTLCYIVMEFLDGGSAENHLERHGAYPVREAARIACDACRGLGAAHESGLVHRDVKPANLLFTSDRVVKVSDFGVAKLTSGGATQLTQAGQIVGTPNYMSPEQCEGSEVDARSDIYSLGATFFSLLVGKTPYSDRKSLVGVISAHCTADPPDPKKHDPTIPDACARIIKKAMAKRPADRFQSMAEMLGDLQSLVDDTPDPMPVRRLSRRGLGLLATAALLGVCFTGWALMNRGGMNSGGNAESSPVPAAAFTGGQVHVGILHSLSGTMRHSEAPMVDGCMLAIEELNKRGGVLGRRIVPVVEDGRSAEATFAAAAEELIEQKKVCTIFGCCTSSSRKAVMQVVERHNHLLVYSVNTEGLETSPNIIYLGGDPIQTVVPCVRWARMQGGMQSFFLVGSDYVYPRVANEVIKDVLVSNGGDLAGEAYLSLGSRDVAPVIAAIREAQPDAIINTISGDSQTAFRRALKASGLRVPQFSTGIGEPELREIDFSGEVGDYSAAVYFQSIATDTNRAFVRRFQEKFGEHRNVNASISTSYAGVLLWAKAVEAAGSISPIAIRNQMLNQKIYAPSGVLQVDPETHYAFRQPMIGRVESDGQFRVVWKGDSLTRPQPFPETRSRLEWGELLKQLQDEWGGRWAAP